MADLVVDNKGEIRLLLGADHYYDVVHSRFIRDEEIVLIPTIYGYALSSQYNIPSDRANVEVVTILKVATHPV